MEGEHYVVVADEQRQSPTFERWLDYHQTLHGEPADTGSYPLALETTLGLGDSTLQGAIGRADLMRRMGHTNVRIARLVFLDEEAHG